VKRLRWKAELDGVVGHRARLGDRWNLLRHQAATSAEDDAGSGLPCEQFRGAFDALFRQARQGSVRVDAAAEDDEHIRAIWEHWCSVL
jgi:hypothetical protein